MAAYSKVHLSATPANGRPIAIAATASPGTVLHTATDGDAAFDELYVWVSNVSAATVKLTLQFGGVAIPGDLAAKDVAVPANSPPIAILVGQSLNGGLVLRAFASVANVLNVTGYVLRIS